MQSRLALTSLLTAVFALCLITPLATAQRGTNRGAQEPQYDPKTEVTIEGAVAEVLSQMMMPETPRGRGQMAGMGMGGTHLKLTTRKGVMDVHLGPSSYLAEKKFTINKGDALEIKGSLVKIDGVDVVIAREVAKGKEKLVLRDANGIPLWSGGYQSR